MFKILVVAIFCLSFELLTQAEDNKDYIGNCVQVSKSGIYHLKTVFKEKTHEFDVLCDEESRDGGWTVVFLRDKGRLEAFLRKNEEYVNGFGSLSREFFIGLEKLHILTSVRSHCLIIIMQDFEDIFYVTYVPEFELNDGDLYQYESLYNYEGTEIGMPLFTWYFQRGWNFEGKYSPKTKNRLNLFGPYAKIGTNVTEFTMGFYNDETQQSIPLRSIKMMIRPVNMYRKSIGETFAFNFYKENDELKWAVRQME